MGRSHWSRTHRATSTAHARTMVAIDISILSTIVVTPMVLCFLDLGQFLKLVDLVASLPTHKRKKFNRTLVSTYHNQPNQLSELLLRLLYETSIKLLGHHDFRSNTAVCRWLTNTHREHGHKQRIQMLISCIKADSNQLGHALRCSWLQFDKV